MPVQIPPGRNERPHRKADVPASILLAEDDDAMRQFVATALTRAGYSVTSRRTGEAAETALEGHYDLLIADVMMPGIDGIELARRARIVDPGLPVMFVTGFAHAALEDGKPIVPEALILSKPFQLRELVRKVRELLPA
jgi:two-component system, cell cycle response regulator CpdR